MKNFSTEAAAMVAAIRESRPGQPEWRFVSGVAEESGEFVQAYNRLNGLSRHPGSRGELITELAQVVTTCWLAASRLSLGVRAAGPDVFTGRSLAGWPEWYWVLQVHAGAGAFVHTYVRDCSQAEMADQLERTLAYAYAAAEVLGIALDDAVTTQFVADMARGWRTADA